MLVPAQTDAAEIIGGGVKYKTFSGQVAQAFTSGTTYSLTKADLGIGNIIPKGFAMLLIGGSDAYDYQGSIYYVEWADSISYNCMANNSTNCTFKGIVFY